MKLTKDQQMKVEQNMGLVGKVMNDHVYGVSGSYTYDDLFQIGCIGLCKAAATDNGGCFSTYAYRLILNEIRSALRKTKRQRENECAMGDLAPTIPERRCDPILRIELEDILRWARTHGSLTVQKGIDSMELLAAGFTCREIGEREHTAANVVSARVSQARKYLMGRGDIQDLCTERSWV